MNHELRVKQSDEMREAYREFGRKRAEYVVAQFNEGIERILKTIGDHRARLEGDVLVIPDFGILKGFTPDCAVEYAVTEVKHIYLHDELRSSEGLYRPISLKLDNIQFEE